MNYQMIIIMTNIMSIPAKLFIPSFFFHLQAIHSSTKENPKSLYCCISYSFLFFLFFLFFIFPIPSVFLILNMGIYGVPLSP